MTDRQIDITFYATLLFWLVACFVLSGCTQAGQASDVLSSPRTRCSTAILISERDGKSRFALISLCPESIKMSVVPMDTLWAELPEVN